MDSQKGRKVLGLVAASLSLTPSVLAQSSIGGETTIQESFVQFFQTILTFPVNSVQEVLLLFIAPIFGFYFIQKNMLNYGFELFEERIDRSSFHRRNEDIPQGIKGLSIVSSFITVLMLGTLGAGILFAAAVLSILLGASMQLGLLESLSGGDSSSRSRSSSSNNTGSQSQSSSQQNQGGDSSVDWENVASNVGSMVSDLSDMNSESGGSGGGPERSMDNALNMMERIQNKAGKGRILDALEKDAVTFNDAIDDAEAAINDGKVEMNSTHDLEKRCNQLVTDLYKFKNVTGGGGDERDIAKMQQNLKDKNRPISQQVQKIEKDAMRIKEAEKKEHNHLKDEIDELIYGAELYAMILGFVARLPKPLTDFKDSQKLRKAFIKRAVKKGVIDKPAGAGKVVKFGKPYQNLAEELRKSLDKLEGELGDINRNMKRAEKLLEDELKLEQDEIDQIKKAIEKITESGELADKIENDISSSSSLDSSNDICQTLLSDLDYVKRELSDVKSELRQLETRMKGDTEYESEMADKLRDIYQK